MTTTTAPITRHLIEVDPHQLDTNTQNHRKDLGDLAGLTDSVRSLGVLEPLLVAGDPARPRIVAGHRRAAAAIAADLATVPCVFLDIDASDTVELASMLVENVQRLDLTDVEEMEAYEQLTALGLDVGQIAETTGVQPLRIEQAVKASQSKPAKYMAQKAQLTIEQAAAFVEFEDDEAILDRLADIAQQDPQDLDHEISYQRQERARDAEAERQRDRLTKAGVKVLTDRPSYNSTYTSLRQLRQSAGVDKHLTVKQHQACPGHTAYIAADRWSPKVDVEYFCSTPREHIPMHYDSREERDKAYGPSSSSSAKKAADMTDAEREKAKAERKRVIDGNKRWRAAAPVRQKFVTELVQHKTCPAGALRYVAGEILARPNLLDEATGAMGQEISGNPDGYKGYDSDRSFAAGAAKVPDKLLPLFLIGQWAASLECLFSDQTWRSAGTPHAHQAARYFAFLETCGYTLSSIEAEVVVMCKTDDA